MTPHDDVNGYRNQPAAMAQWLATRENQPEALGSNPLANNNVF